MHTLQLHTEMNDIYYFKFNFIRYSHNYNWFDSINAACGAIKPFVLSNKESFKFDKSDKKRYSKIKMRSASRGSRRLTYQVPSMLAAQQTVATTATEYRLKMSTMRII